MGDPSAPRMRYKVIGLSPRELVKAHGKAGLENGRGSPRKANGPRMPKREMGHRSPQIV